jgi:hypothetical protein
MSSFLSNRRDVSFGRSGRCPSFGRSASARLIFAAVAITALACGDDDPAPETGAGGALNVPDASVRDLPGDGLETTPESDIDSRQRDPIGPVQLGENIDDIRNDIGTSPDGNPYADAAAPDADAGSE